MGRAAGFSFAGIVRVTAIGAACVGLAACSGSKFAGNSKYSDRVVADGEPIPKGGGSYKVGQPYRLNGKTYFPSENPSYRAEGIASWYGPDFHGRLTANGEVYDMHSISAAHPTMPLPSYARVTNLENGRSIVVRVNDRGPYAQNRVIDLSIGTAKALEFYKRGLARVRVEYVGRAPIEGSDDRMLMATLRQGGPAPAPSLVMVASVKPFIPETPDGAERDTASARVPPARPFAVSPAPSRVAAQPASDSPSLPRREASAAGRSPAAVSSVPVAAASPPARPSPVSAFAPTSGDNALGFMSGRGLY